MTTPVGTDLYPTYKMTYNNIHEIPLSVFIKAKYAHIKHLWLLKYGVKWMPLKIDDVLKNNDIANAQEALEGTRWHTPSFCIGCELLQPTPYKVNEAASLLRHSDMYCSREVDECPKRKK